MAPERPPSQQVVDAVTGSAGAVIPSLQANPETAVAGDAAAAAMIDASKVTTGLASLVVLIGLAATWALPYVPPPAAEPRSSSRRRGRKRSADDGDTSDGAQPDEEPDTAAA